ncbi:MAG: hypothetical protein LBU65_04895 [Planctomycetaceae bacterium]|jgi:hypothetical protein|nr:hypothetical protein [Planctomycetaceae bacterium]
MMRLFIHTLFIACFLCGNDALFAEDIRITSPLEKTALTYTVGLIQGELADIKAAEVRLVNPRIHRDGKFVLGQAYQGKFKVLAPLQKGVNKLTLTSGKPFQTYKLLIVH